MQFEKGSLFGGDSAFTYSSATALLSVSSVSASFVSASTFSAVRQIRFADGTVQVSSPLAEVGDISSVTAGTNLTGGGSSDAVTLNLDANISLSTVTAPAVDFSTGVTVYRIEWADGTIQTSSPTAVAAGAVEKSVTQVGHPFSVGDVVRHNGTIYVKAAATDTAHAEVIGIVSEVLGSTFKITTHGYIIGLSGLTAGTVYFLSTTTAGGLQTVEPTATGHVSKPILVADSTTSGYVINYRGQVLQNLTDNYIANTNSLQSGATFFVSSGSVQGQLIVNGQMIGKGTATNDSAASGFIGEYTSSNVSSFTNFPTSTQYGDVVSVTLSAGDWDISGNVVTKLNGATFTSDDFFGGIGLTSGNNAPIAAPDGGYFESGAPVSGGDRSIPLTPYRVSISGSTTYFLKIRATYSSGPPQYKGMLRARRMR